MKLLLNCLIIVFIIFLSSCTQYNQLKMVTQPSSGFWQTLLIAELTTNFSSLLYDKTKPEFIRFDTHYISPILVNSSFYVFSYIKVDKYGRKSVDDSHAKLLENFIIINGYGKVVKDVSKADYIVAIDIKDEDTFTYAKNQISVNVIVMDKDENVMFSALSLVESKSDSNFYYQPSKSARPSSYLLLKGFERILTEAMPKAFS